MDWPLALVVVAGIAAFAVVVVKALPYVVKRTDDETRLAALEAASVELNSRVTFAEQALGGVGVLGRLPRAGVSR